MISSDRHDRLLPLYFSRPIGRGSYVLAKLLATGLLTLSIVAPAGRRALARERAAGADEPLRGAAR